MKYLNNGILELDLRKNGEAGIFIRDWNAFFRFAQKKKLRKERISKLFPNDGESLENRIKANLNQQNFEFECYLSDLAKDVRVSGYRRNKRKLVLVFSVLPVYQNQEKVIKGDERKRNSSDNVILPVKEHSYSKPVENLNGNVDNTYSTVSSFFANLSHETRNPLNAIIGFGEYLKSIYHKEESREEYFDMIINSGRKLLKVINNLLWFIWLETDEVKINPSASSLNDELDKVYDDLYDPYYDQSIKSRVEFKIRYGLAKGEDRLFIDSFSLNEVLKRLLDNAFKNTSEGEVEMGYELKDAENLMFYVQDTGHGIPDDRKNEIFDTKRQLREEIYDDSKGVGLGLNIARRLVHSMGGELKFYSTVNEGSCFYFILPCKFAKSDENMENKGQNYRESEYYLRKINENQLVS